MHCIYCGEEIKAGEVLKHILNCKEWKERNANNKTTKCI